MVFDAVRAKEPVINEYFCRGRHNNCIMVSLNQNLFSLDRQSVRENCNLFILFEQRSKVVMSKYRDFFNNVALSYNDFSNICNKVWKEPYNYIVIDITKNKNINGKLRIIWDRRVFKLSMVKHGRGPISKSMSIREPASQISLSKCNCKSKSMVIRNCL